MIACVSRMTSRSALPCVALGEAWSLVVSFFSVFLAVIHYCSPLSFPTCNLYSMRILRNCLSHMLGPLNNDQIRWIGNEFGPAKGVEFISRLEAIRIDMYEQ